MESTFIKLSREQTRQLLLSNLVFLRTDLWQLEPGSLQVAIEKQAGRENVEERAILLHVLYKNENAISVVQESQEQICDNVENSDLNEAKNNCQKDNTEDTLQKNNITDQAIDIELPEDVIFNNDNVVPPPLRLAVTFVLPGEPFKSEPVNLYRAIDLKDLSEPLNQRQIKISASDYACDYFEDKEQIIDKKDLSSSTTETESLQEDNSNVTTSKLLLPGPIPGSVVKLSPKDQLGSLSLFQSIRYNVETCSVNAPQDPETEKRYWPIDVTTDPKDHLKALALCPICNAPAKTWHSCEVHGLYCGTHEGYCQSCREHYCAICCSSQCIVGHEKLCSNCSSIHCSCCDGIVCKEHSQICSECQKPFCNLCSGGTCSIGGTPLCKNCSSVCQSCGKTVRSRHLSPCYACGLLICPSCRDICHIDGRVMCSNHQGSCGECGAPICEKHRQYCTCCGNPHCKKHLYTCRICHRQVCTYCLMSTDICKQCRTIEKLPEDTKDIVVQQLHFLAKGKDYQNFTTVTGSLGPQGWMFALKVGLNEYRVTCDDKLTKVTYELKRSFIARLFNK